MVVFLCFNPQLFRTLSLLVIGLLSLRRAECRMNPASESFSYESTTCRAHSVSLTDFGGVGDGVTSNTKAFKAAISHLSQYVSDGGGQLYVPQGRWVTGSFNLTSRFTLFLHRDAVILGSQVCFLSPPISKFRVGYRPWEHVSGVTWIMTCFGALSISLASPYCLQLFSPPEPTMI